MPNLQRDDVKRALRAKGFEEEEGDHWYFRLYVDGKKSKILTKVSRGTKYKTLSAGLVSFMARQCKLSGGDFSALIECTLDHEGYVAKLRRSEDL